LVGGVKIGQVKGKLLCASGVDLLRYTNQTIIIIGWNISQF